MSSRRAAKYNMTVQRGASWQDEFEYTDADGAPVDLTGKKARMQVRTMAGRFGTSTTTTLLLTLDDTDDKLVVDTPASAGIVVLNAPASDTVLLNPLNRRRQRCAYAIELYDDSVTPEEVIPLAYGTITVLGETTR